MLAPLESSSVSVSLPVPLAPRLSFVAGLDANVRAWLEHLFNPKPRPLPNPLTPATFDEFVLTHRLAVVHFWTPRNERDQLMARLLATQVPVQLRQQIAFASFNIDPPNHFELTRQLKVFDVPFLAFYREGLLLQTSIGLYAPGIIVKQLRDLAGPHVAI